MLKQVDGEQDEGDGEPRPGDPEEGTKWSSPLIHHVGALGDWAAAAGEGLCVAIHQLQCLPSLGI